MTGSYNAVRTGKCALAGMLLMLIFSSEAQAGADDVVAGDTGVLYVSGTLARGACNIESDTAQQTVDFATVSSGELRYPGDRGRGKDVHLRLRDCFDNEATATHIHTGNEEIGDGLPFVRVSFMGAVDPDNSSLIAVHGAGGFGLRLEDQQHHVVRLNEQGEPLRVASGNPVLTYSLSPERTHVPLKEGAWQVVVYIGLSYD
ncbi:fimbrial protein [Erwinia amylovora]